MKFFDRVKDTTTTTGTGPYTVSGTPPTGFKTFADRLSVGDTFYGVIAAGSEWVSGIMTYSAANQITVTTVLASSNADAAVSFSAGTKDIFLMVDAQFFTLNSIITPTAPYNAGTVDANATIDPVNGLDQYLTIGNNATTGITLAITSPAVTTYPFYLDLEVIRSSGNQRVITLTGGNIESTGGLLASGKVLPSSGASARDFFRFKWQPRNSKYITRDALYDEKA